MGGCEASATIPECCGTRPPPESMRAALNALWERDLRVVTLADLESVSSGLSVESVAKTLRERGWLLPLRASGAWRLARWQYRRTLGFEELLARLSTRPGTPAAIAGKSMVETRGWLKRPTEPAVGVPPGYAVPRCLQGFWLHRWQPRSPLDTVEELPVWSPAVLVAYAAARPARLGFGDASEWLPQVCSVVDVDALSAELAGRPRSVWMKAAFVLWRGGADAVSEQIASQAPQHGRGPYRFGVRTQRWGGTFHRDFDVVDYIFVRHWQDPTEHFIQWDPVTVAGG